MFICSARIPGELRGRLQSLPFVPHSLWAPRGNTVGGKCVLGGGTFRSCVSTWSKGTYVCLRRPCRQCADTQASQLPLELLSVHILMLHMSSWSILPIRPGRAYLLQDVYDSHLMRICWTSPRCCQADLYRSPNPPLWRRLLLISPYI